MTVSYPIPLYANVAIEADFYAPRKFNISAITFGLTTIVTTTIDHDFTIGSQLRLIIPIPYGSRELNNAEGYVISIPASNQVEIAIDSINTKAFTNPGTGTPAQIKPIGDINSGVINSSGQQNLQTYIDGSFINISPN